MKQKRIFYCEFAYFVGIFILAFGNALMEKANFGVSMVVAPAYLIHLKVSQYLPFFSFGMSGYVLQAFLLCFLSLIMRKVKKSYFLSFVTAFIYGVVLDIIMSVIAFLPHTDIAWRILFYSVGLVTCSTGVAFLFHTYFPPEAYDLFVKETSQKYNIPIGKIKTIYDCCSCVFGVILSLCFFGGFVGVKFGTIICAVINGFLIGKIGKFLENKFIFKDALPLRDKLN